ncbi:hypothetical protein OHS33_21850 [Streptomyces sp. NBC_00536]|uniref:hypothetical protein n=1 Tax=Streptomyces sp. NBC_00536 TaxID=2975769 RepID=UPI002E8176C3|nr:hypothetical protein [Streptomyces sp. NBC_00536]WUC80737.1 hypothetical protein OHS33_21850 [Streptomyces sp. NBC_00536]
MSAHPPLGRPLFEPVDRNPALAALRAAVQRHDWAAVAAVFDAPQYEEDRVVASRVVADTLGAEGFLLQVVEQRPRDPLARILLADRYVQIGWDIRSGARAEHVSKDQFQEFHAYLRRAEMLLIDVCAEYPALGLAWFHRVITARGLELGQSEARRRYDRLSEHHPHHYPAQMQLLQKLCPKWGGSWEAAHGFAWDSTVQAPEGSPNGALVALAQMEQWLELKGGAASEAYLRDPAQHARLRDAAARSVLHPHFRAQGSQAIGAHSAFAAVHSVAGRHAEAAPHFRALGDHASEFPWSYVKGGHEAAFVRHRKTALAQG